MARIEAVERIAHGVICDNCEKIYPVRNNSSLTEGFFVQYKYVSEYNIYETEELFFCDKNCFINAIRWKNSQLYNRGIKTSRNYKKRQGLKGGREG